MKKNYKIISLLTFFFISFLGIFILYHAKREAITLLSEAQNKTESGLNKIEKKESINPIILWEHNGKTMQTTYYRTTGQSLDKPHNFAEVSLKNISPLTCHFIIKTQNPIQMRLFVNKEEKFFGSDSSICFQKMNNHILFYFEIYNYTSDFQMKEPALCYSNEDCSIKSEVCANGYCKNITNQ